MPQPHRAEVFAALSASTFTAARLCELCLQLLPGIDGASLTVIGNSSAHATVSVAGDRSGELPDLQLKLGEGPYLDAHDTRRPVLASDLSETEYRVRWPAFVAAGLAAGVHAVFAFPLRVGALHVGVLNLHRRVASPLDSVELADALIFAEAATMLILDRSAPNASGLSRLRVDHHAAVHQATGVIMAQLDISVAEAFVRLRAHAYVDGRTLDAVATEVIARRIRFDVEDSP